MTPATAPWRALARPLEGADATELLARAGLPAALLPSAHELIADPAFVDALWDPAVQWQLGDLDVPEAFGRWLHEPSAALLDKLPLLGLVSHASAIRRLIRAREQQAIRDAVGRAAFVDVFERPPGEHAAPDVIDAALLVDDARGELERAGCRWLASAAATFGRGWKEVLRLRLPRRLESSVTSGGVVWERDAACRAVEELLPRVDSMLGADRSGAALAPAEGR